MSVRKRKRLLGAISAASRRVSRPATPLSTLSYRPPLLVKGLIESRSVDAFVVNTPPMRAEKNTGWTAVKGLLRSEGARGGWLGEFEHFGRSTEAFWSSSTTAVISKWAWSGSEKRQRAETGYSAGPSAKTLLTDDGSIRRGRIGK